MTTKHFILRHELGEDHITVVESDNDGAFVNYARDYRTKRGRRLAAVVGKWRLDVWEEFNHNIAVTHIKTGAVWPDNDFYWESAKNEHASVTRYDP